MVKYALNSSYLRSAFKPTEVLVQNAVQTLEGVEYDTMIGSGTSGLLVIPLLARALKKEFAIVRKPNDSSHREVDIEGTIGGKWIFVDDFVASGATRTRVKTAVEEAQRKLDFTSEFLGTYEYDKQNWVPVRPAVKFFCGCCPPDSQ